MNEIVTDSIRKLVPDMIIEDLRKVVIELLESLDAYRKEVSCNHECDSLSEGLGLTESEAIKIHNEIHILMTYQTKITMEIESVWNSNYDLKSKIYALYLIGSFHQKIQCIRCNFEGLLDHVKKLMEGGKGKEEPE